jgi:flagellar capping protein FliD
VAGTVGGLAATGAGQLLTVTGDGKANGLTVRVTATAADVAGAGGSLALGSLTYTAGVAQRLDSVGYWAVDTVSGTITTAVNGRRSENTAIDNQVDAWDLRLRLREAALRRQFTALERALGTMRSQSTWLSGQIAGLPSAAPS